MRIRNCCCLPIILLVVMGHVSRAQDNHYAWMQYGSLNSIMYQSGVSRFEDQSAVIVNPATLAGARISSFNFNTNVFGFNNIKFTDGLGKGFTINSSNLNVLPSMASGVWKPKNEQKKWVLGYALYHANTDNLIFSDRAEDKINLVNETESPGEEDYLAQFTLNNSLDEFTAIAGLGWKMKEHLSLGISQSFTYRSVEYREAFSAYVLSDPALNAPLDLAGTNIDFYTKYYAMMATTRLGLTYNTHNWDFGIVVGLPTFTIFGQGDILADLSLTNVRLDSNLAVPRRNFLANGQIEKIKAKYKYPFHVTLGASHLFGKIRLYGALNWFAELKEYTVMDPGDASFIQPPSSDNVLYTSKLLRVWSGNRSVFNFSIAGDWTLRSGNNLLFSVRSDQNYGYFDRAMDGKNLAIKQWTNLHLTLGNKREYRRSAWVFGVRVNFGKNDNYPQPVSFADPSEDNFLQGQPAQGTIKSYGLQALLSYTFNLGSGGD